MGNYRSLPVVTSRNTPQHLRADEQPMANGELANALVGRCMFWKLRIDQIDQDVVVEEYAVSTFRHRCARVGTAATQAAPQSSARVQRRAGAGVSLARLRTE